MKRRLFFKKSGLVASGIGLSGGLSLAASVRSTDEFILKKAKNVIFLVSDGMSQGTLTMADQLKQRKYGKPSIWLELYRQEKVRRGLMDMASENSLVTDSAAAASSWGCGHRVPNGRVNIGRNGEHYKPLWQKFMDAGKKAGIVTSVPATHATPAGFCVNSKSRNDQDGIAEKYADLNMQVVMGGGQKYFDPQLRKDNKDMFAVFKNKNYEVVTTKTQLLNSTSNQPILGLFSEDALPYELDRLTDTALLNNTPSLREMTAKALENLSQHPQGFVLQVEGGKVDWAAHANDPGALLYDQLAFDDAVEEAILFAEKNQETLVIITSDHGNANPGLMYGKDTDKNFEKIHHFKNTNEWILNSIDKNFTVSQVMDLIVESNYHAISQEQAASLLNFYAHLEKPLTGLYDYKKLPFQLLSQMQREYLSLGWMSDNHTGDYVELAAYGPGSHLVKGFMKNTELHYLLLDACQVTN